MYRPLCVRLHKNLRAAQDLRFDNREEVRAILYDLLRELKTVVAHFKRDEDAASDLEAILVDQVLMALDYIKDLAKAEDR